MIKKYTRNNKGLRESAGSSISQDSMMDSQSEQPLLQTKSNGQINHQPSSTKTAKAGAAVMSQKL